MIPVSRPVLISLFLIALFGICESQNRKLLITGQYGSYIWSESGATISPYTRESSSPFPNNVWPNGFTWLNNSFSFLVGTYNYQPQNLANQRRMYVWRVNSTSAISLVKAIDLSGLNSLYQSFYDTYIESQRYAWTASWFNDRVNVRDFGNLAPAIPSQVTGSEFPTSICYDNPSVAGGTGSAMPITSTLAVVTCYSLVPATGAGAVYLFDRTDPASYQQLLLSTTDWYGTPTYDGAGNVYIPQVVARRIHRYNIWTQTLELWGAQAACVNCAGYYGLGKLRAFNDSTMLGILYSNYFEPSCVQQWNLNTGTRTTIVSSDLQCGSFLTDALWLPTGVSAFAADPAWLPLSQPAPVAAPVNPPTAPAPVATPVAAPVAQPAAAPVATPIAAPAPTPVVAPAPTPVAAPVAVPVAVPAGPAPVQAPQAAPVAPTPVVSPPSQVPVAPTPVLAPQASPVAVPAASPQATPSATPVTTVSPQQAPVGAPASPQLPPAKAPVAAPLQPRFARVVVAATQDSVSTTSIASTICQIITTRYPAVSVAAQDISCSFEARKRKRLVGDEHAVLITFSSAAGINLRLQLGASVGEQSGVLGDVASTSGQQFFGVRMEFDPLSTFTPGNIAPKASPTAVSPTQAPSDGTAPSGTSSIGGGPVGDSGGANGTGIGVGIGIAILIIAIIIVVVIIIMRRRKSKQKKTDGDGKKKSGTKSVVLAPDDESVIKRNADNYAPLDLNPKSSAKSGTAADVSTTEKSKTTAPSSMLISYDELEFGTKLGAGAFGAVYRGTWRGSPVAIKETVSGSREVFLKEIETTIALRPHGNVVQIFGVCLLGTGDDAKALLIMEFVPHGSLQDLLEKLKRRDKSLSVEQKIRIALGVASGMSHLHAEKILHRDLAVRNILVAAGRVPKISDFGLSQTGPAGAVDEDSALEIVEKTGPVRWMAPESIREHKYSTKTDVFSFGILLWELMTDGEVPHGDQPLRDVAIARRDHCTVPEIPADAPEILVKIARKCWAPLPEDRPPFKKIVTMLSNYVAENFEEDSDFDPASPRFGKLTTMESTARGTSASGALLSGSVATLPNNESKNQISTD